MNAYKVTLLVIGFDGIKSKEIDGIFESAHFPNDCISPSVMKIETADIGEWNDDHPLNDHHTNVEEFQKLFP